MRACRAEHSKIGISRVAWSANSAFIATKSDQMPYNVWIWLTESLTLHCTISLLESVRSVQWDPVHIRLAITSGGNHVYLWTPEGVSWVDIPIGESHLYLSYVVVFSLLALCASF